MPSQMQSLIKHSFLQTSRCHLITNEKFTLNSSKVKLTRQTPHHGSIEKSTGCVGSNSFAIDLFSFHIIFWKSPKPKAGVNAIKTLPRKSSKYFKKIACNELQEFSMVLCLPA